jgi:hypothetical protein
VSEARLAIIDTATIMEQKHMWKGTQAEHTSREASIYERMRIRSECWSVWSRLLTEHTKSLSFGEQDNKIRHDESEAHAPVPDCLVSASYLSQRLLDSRYFLPSIRLG